VTIFAFAVRDKAQHRVSPAIFAEAAKIISPLAVSSFLSLRAYSLSLSLFLLSSFSSFGFSIRSRVPLLRSLAALPSRARRAFNASSRN
jgi:hypothetical protein